MQTRFIHHAWLKTAIGVVGGCVLLWAPPLTLAEATWTIWPVANSPSNSHHDATYDSANQRIVMCGRSNNEARCYFLTLTNGWQDGPAINTTTGSDIEVSYDSARAVTVLYTVTNNTVPVVYELANNVWTQRSFATSPVACGDGALMCYDPVRQKTVLVAATNAEATSDSETWLWDGTNWTQVAGSPRGAAGGSMTFDVARRNMVLLPFYATNTWTFDGTTWTAHQTAHVPTTSVWVARMAYDPVNEVAIEFGGEHMAATNIYPTNTWAWNGSDWQMLTTTSYPPSTIDMAMLWFPPMNSIIMHGGWGPDDGWLRRNTVWVFSNAPAVSLPAGVTASKGTYNDRVAVSWQPVAGAGGYRVYRNDSNTTVNAVVIGWPANTNYDDTSATADMTYYYWVKATNSYGVSYFSSSDYGYRSGLTPAAPGGVTASDGTFTDKVQVIWDVVTNATGYTVWRSETNDTNSASVYAEGIATTNYDDTAAITNIVYYYWVKATNVAGASAFSSSDSGYVLGVPAAPTNVIASQGTYVDKIRLTWDAVSNAASYEGWRNTIDDSSSASRSAVDFTTTSADDEAITPGAAYYYWIRAKNAAGTSGFSSAAYGYAVGIYSAVAADFDGDAKADPAVYNTNGTWKMKLSSTPNYTLVTLSDFLGGSGCSALAADFDGDRIADPAIYNGALEAWVLKLSSAHYLPVDIFSFGGSDWQALAGDFDGDAKADPALYQASTGTWKIRLSSADYLTITKAGFMGWTGWQAIAADFDGDGKVDPTIYHSSTSSWIIMLSRSNYALAVLGAHFLGGSEYICIGADFDGDGKADPTVAKTSSGHWKIRLSSGGYTVVDLPELLGK